MPLILAPLGQEVRIVVRDAAGSLKAVCEHVVDDVLLDDRDALHIAAAYI